MIYKLNDNLMQNVYGGVGGLGSGPGGASFSDSMLTVPGLMEPMDMTGKGASGLAKAVAGDGNNQNS